MDWKIWTSILFLVSFILIWSYHKYFRKENIKFIFFTITNCIACPFGIFAFSFILVKWLKAKDIVGTPSCSLENYPICFSGHCVFLVFLVLLFCVFSILAWRDFRNKRLVPLVNERNNLRPTFESVYYSQWLIDKNWIALPILLILLIGIWSGVI